MTEDLKKLFPGWKIIWERADICDKGYQACLVVKGDQAAYIEWDSPSSATMRDPITWTYAGPEHAKNVLAGQHYTDQVLFDTLDHAMCLEWRIVVAGMCFRQVDNNLWACDTPAGTIELQWYFKTFEAKLGKFTEQAFTATTAVRAVLEKAHTAATAAAKDADLLAQILKKGSV